MLTYLCISEAGGKSGRNQVMAKKKKPTARIVLVVGVSVVPLLISKI
jgi:hypothetical protein